MSFYCLRHHFYYTWLTYVRSQADQITTRPSTPLAVILSVSIVFWRRYRLTAEAQSPVGLLVDPHGVHCVLVRGLELDVGLSLAFEIHLPEHVQRRLFARTGGCASLILQRSSQLPSVLVATEAERFTILAMISTLVWNEQTNYLHDRRR